MEFELAADAEAAVQVGRLKALVACRDGRPATRTVKVTWHDSLDHALLAQGMTLAEQRGVWRMERLVPDRQTWLPAQPAPVFAESEDRSALPDLPGPLAPLAAFDGRRTTSVHALGESPVTLAIERGILRAVAAERPAARILLAGEERAVREVALLIAAAVPVSVPSASLGAEGVALATGTPPPPRHGGAPVLPDGAISVADALAHIIGHLTDVILDHVARLDEGPEAVHQMRVAVRRARSALSVFREALPPGALDTVSDGLKALGSRLGPTRDWDVFAGETAPAIQRALPGDARLERLVGAAERRRRDCRKALVAWLGSTEFRLIGIELAWFAAARFWRPAAGPEPGSEPAPVPVPLAAFAGGVLQSRHKKLVSAGKRMEELDIPALHGVRLRAKRARYAAEMFAALHHGKAASRFIKRLGVLQQRLGVLNDGAVATHLMAELGGAGGRHAYAAGIVAGFMAARAAKIRPRIIDAFERFRRQPGYWA
jgi:CHAD domain-containing protein